MADSQRQAEETCRCASTPAIVSITDSPTIAIDIGGFQEVTTAVVAPQDSNGNDHGRAGAGALTAVREHYAELAQTRHLGRDFETHSIRTCNNFVKSCIIDISIRALTAQPQVEGKPALLSVADIACGRGQDFPKWMHAVRKTGINLDIFYGMDAADTMGAAAELLDCTVKPLANRALLCIGDMCEGFPGLPDGSVDIVSCQLALHYLCDRGERLDGFFKECARVLCRKGLLLISYTDGRSVVRRGRDLLKKHPCPEYNVRISGVHYTIEIPSMHLRSNIETQYGCRYIFTLTGSVNALPEYLCHDGNVSKVASGHGFHKGASMYFDDAARTFLKQKWAACIAQKMRFGDVAKYKIDGTLDTANLYRFSVYSKSTTTLTSWGMAASGEDGTTAKPYRSIPRKCFADPDPDALRETDEYPPPLHHQPPPPNKKQRV